jgi:hypothetical protein
VEYIFGAGSYTSFNASESAFVDLSKMLRQTGSLIVSGVSPRSPLIELYLVEPQ